MEIKPRLALTLPVASGLACGAFAVSILVGVSVGHSASAIIARSLVVMLVVWPVGLILGAMLERIFREHGDPEVSARSEGLSETETDNGFDFVDEAQAESDGSVAGVEPIGVRS